MPVRNSEGATAGAEGGDEIVVLMQANMVGVPDLRALVAEHEASGADLSVVRGGETKVAGLGRDANQIFIASPSVLESIPEVGYCDIKEGLIPTLVQKGMKVRWIAAPEGWGTFGTWKEYLQEVLQQLAVSGWRLEKPSSGVAEEWRSGGEPQSRLVDEESSSRVGGEAGGKGRRIDEETTRRGASNTSGVAEEWRSGGELQSSPVVRKSGSQVDEGARVVGEVWIGHGAQIEEEAVVVGPAVIGRNCRIGRGAVVFESVMWDGSVVEEGAAVTECLVGAGAVVGAGVEAAGVWCRGTACRARTVAPACRDRATHGQDARATSCRGIPARSREVGTSFKNSLGRLGKACRAPANKVIEDVETVWTKIRQAVAARLSALLGDRIPTKAWWWMGWAAIASCFLWSYWNPTIVSLWRLWMRSDEFSSGLLVPFLAMYILWSRRHKLEGVVVRPAIVWGLAAFAVAQAGRFFGLWLMYGSAENLSLVASICALVLLLFGWQVVWRVWPVLGFLLLMLPFPHRVQGWITQPLQRFATSSAVFGLETLGFEVGRHGNVIELNGTMVAVAEACNGLRMLTAFVVITALVALVVERKWWEKAIILISSVPIAFVCNTLRLVITAIAFTHVNTEAWEKAFHDFGGLAMMPVALGMVMGLLWLMGQVVVREEHAAEIPQVVKKLSSGAAEQRSSQVVE